MMRPMMADKDINDILVYLRSMTVLLLVQIQRLEKRI